MSGILGIDHRTGRQFQGKYTCTHWICQWFLLRIKLLAFFGLLLFVGLLAVWRASEQNVVQVFEVRGNTMGTRYSIKLPEYGRIPSPGSLKTQIDQRLFAIENSMSTWRSDSELSRFNRSHSAQWFPVSHELAEVVAVAKLLHQQSAGAFDISVGPLVNIWGFGSDDGFVEHPDAEQIARAQARLGMSEVHVRLHAAPAIQKTLSGVYLDLSAIAKGYAVDQLALLLDGMGIVNYLVEIGGEVRVRGVNARGQVWRLAVEKPFANGRAAALVFPLAQGAVATSGSYRNFREQNGQRFSHAINPSTGRPVAHNLLSVTVLDDSAMRADAMATALLVMGPEEGMRWAVERALGVLFIVAVGDQTVLRATGRFTAWVDMDDNNILYPVD